MAANEARKPISVCTVCGTYGRNINAINERCAARSGRTRCKGVMGSAMNEDDWQPCQSCDGTDRNCMSCQGSGWRYVRR